MEWTNPKNCEGWSLCTVSNRWLCGLGLTTSDGRELITSEGCAIIGCSASVALGEEAQCRG